MRCSRTTSPSRRPAFTLIEILVVIAIIAVLVALTSAAVFYWIGSQQRHNTELAINTVNKVLQRQWSYVVDQAKKETPSAAVTYMAKYTASGADGDPTGARARVLWAKIRLMEAFPISYAEVNGSGVANAPNAVNSFLYSSAGTYANASGNVTLGPCIPSAQYKYLIGYQRTLGNGSLYNDNTGTSATESAACLLMALSIARGGSSLSADDVKNFVADTDQDGVKELVDNFQTALTFYRFAWNVAGGTPNIDGLKPAAQGTRNYTLADPLDQGGLLLTWTNGKNTPRANYESIVHTIGYTVNNTSYAYYVIPVIVSSGPDLQLGLPMPPQVAASGLAQQSNFANDDIFSFNLKGN